MNKSKIHLLNELECLLMEIPSIVTSFQNKEVGIIGKLTKWLSTAETTLKDNKLSRCAELAGLRAKLLHAGMTTVGMKRKEQYTVGLDIIYPAQTVVQELAYPIKAKIDQAKQMLQQTISLAAAINVIRNNDSCMDFNIWVDASFKAVRIHDKLSAGITNAVALAGYFDAYTLFAEELLDYYNGQ